MSDSTALRRAEAVRHFNRFYTKHIGELHDHLHNSEFSLTEVRVLRELALGRAQTAAALARGLGLDSGYLSRLLTGFERRKLINRQPSTADARQSMLSLTDNGRAAYQPLDAAAIREVSAMLAKLADNSQEQLIGAMKLIERLINEGPRHGAVMLRGPKAGDYGFLVQRQAQLFANGYGWDHRFEGLLARTVAAFSEDHDPQRETCMIAEQRGTVAGSALITQQAPDTARVQMLYVEPDVQRLGIGTHLMNECVHFARRAGYTKLSVTTATTLLDARRLFAHAGFIRMTAEPAQRFGRQLVLERWVRNL
ncbi:bifunctional helix-turn-helix transcriptional regulator/GNAT family N-acetyltransferase [Paraburkholderia sp. SARCC-3016]|uniref:bifunctional helix-turn-helix transcriptional regulator/GNAT family N-acetyltransferase n=1 Tax=Paraburkholderia sp. SARCC-3016 TaxID=3058611 RepID=UPI002809F99D|nr:bifunctional helix-turn-helix transcriptional regulator/GNAT family N-acetyltransferase [Paraburkholderia sp. SARCC-3016]MDQ7981207.1 bifunctional helix-turn-helix transcriptional regulator/GNAT family N-acetyltransferase [Paraburkholderia sp. SARCC-3016]